MSLVKKAFNIDDDNKVLAKTIYKKALTRLADNFGSWDVDNAHTQLSVEFGELWILYVEDGNYDIAAVQRANNAFNYANLQLGADYKILDTAKTALDRRKYIEANVFWLKRSAADFNMLLTHV